MGKRYDTESLLLDVQQILKDNLNNKINAISTEKGDTIADGTKEVPDDAYFVLSMNDKVNNFPVAVFLDLMNLDPDAAGPATAKTHHILAMLIAGQNRNDSGQAFRMFRYQRALEEVFQENFGATQSSFIKMDPFPPGVIQIANSSKPFLATGVVITTSIVS